MMKTVQQWLREIDRQELVNTYQFLYPPEFWRLKNEEISVAEVYRRQAELLNNFIDELLQLTPSHEDAKMIFLATSAYKDGFPDEQATLVAVDELDENSLPESYSWMLTDREKLVGYKIADSELTLDNMCSILAQIIEESSFLGYSKDTFESERESLIQSLEQSEKDIEDGNVYSADEVWEHLGLKREAPDPKADELRAGVIRAEVEYNQYYRSKELSALMRKLTEEQINEPHKDQ
jgi:hypothetical protein